MDFSVLFSNIYYNIFILVFSQSKKKESRNAASPGWKKNFFSKNIIPRWNNLEWIN